MEPNPNSNGTKAAGWLVALLLLCCAVTMPLLACAHRFVTTPVAPAEPVEITIPAGASFRWTAKELARRHVVDDELSFRVLAWIRGAEKHIKAGRYLFDKAATPDVVLARLTSGDVFIEKITIPEGYTIHDVAKRLAEKGRGTPDSILKIMEDPEFIRTAGLAGETSLEGYLFPATYDLPDGLSTEDFLKTMVREFLGRLNPALRQAAQERGLTLHQWVTLASIIQKESGKEEEMPLISAVFHNRLKLGMPLQADPTVIYGLKKFEGKLTKRDLAADSPYNTYQIAGLPPGPIANPGLAALSAAVCPAPVEYLYFVARGDGYHSFSGTLDEHNEAVRRYRKLQAERRAALPDNEAARK